MIFMSKISSKQPVSLWWDFVAAAGECFFRIRAVTCLSASAAGFRCQADAVRKSVAFLAKHCEGLVQLQKPTLELPF